MNTLQLFASTNQQLVINIEAWQAILGVCVIVITALGSYFKLQNDVKHLNADFNGVKTDVKKYGNKIAGISSSIDALSTSVNLIIQDKYAAAHSPRKLTSIGIEVLENSGIKDAIDSNKKELLLMVQQADPQTIYDAEEYAIDAIKTYFTDEDHQDLNNTIKTKTFRMGQSIDIVYFVGGIYFRDFALPEMGFDVKDIDDEKSKVRK